MTFLNNNLIIIFLFLFLTKNIYCSNIKNEDKKIVIDFLQNISSMKCNFNQELKLNKIEEKDIKYLQENQININGTFIMKRPRKVIFEYKNKSQNAKIIIDGDVIKYYDKILNQVTFINRDHLPSIFIFFDNDFTNLDHLIFKEINIKEKSIEACFNDSLNKEHNLLICIIFNKINNSKEDKSSDFSISKIEKIISHDDIGNEIEILLTNCLMNIDINNDVFMIKDPRIFEDE